MKEIYLAGGCFWGVEAYFARMSGVIDTEVGYANGETKAPIYDEVKKGTTGFAETCKIKYNPDEIKLEKILEAYWGVIDPTILNRQGPDTGTQYRTGIYYVDGSDLTVIEESLRKEQSKYNQKIVTEVETLKNFYEAEQYHQDYLKKNPNGYCHIKLD